MISGYQRARVRRALHILTGVFVFLASSLTALNAASLSLRESLIRALTADPSMAAGLARVRGAEAGIAQARRYPNPSIGLDIENAAGSGPYRGSQQAETTLFLQQQLEFESKRTARTNVAISELNLTRARSIARVLDFSKEVETAWIEVLATSAQLDVASQKLKITQEVQEEIRRRSEAGRDPLFAVVRADTQFALDQVALERAKSNSRIAKENLASYWKGSARIEVSLASFEIPKAQAYANIASAEIAILEADAGSAEARARLERSRAIPEPTVKLGMRHFNDTKDTAVVGGISIPLPVYDNNRDNIERAEAERDAAESDLAAAKRSLKRDYVRLTSHLKVLATEAQRIKSEVIPQAERALQLIREGLGRGAFSYADLADAQRTLNDTYLKRVEILKNFYLEKAALSRLTGEHARLAAFVEKRQ